MGDDSDSTGKGKPNLTTPPAREKRKPFFKKQASDVCHAFFSLVLVSQVSDVLQSGLSMPFPLCSCNPVGVFLLLISNRSVTELWAGLVSNLLSP